jgi:hypothetical protein
MVGMRVDVQDVPALTSKAVQVRRPFDQPKPEAGHGLIVGHGNPGEVFAGCHLVFHPRAKFRDHALHGLVVRKAQIEEHASPLLTD